MSIVTTTEVERASDQQLQQEVAQPTGALGPAYVVVGEILKRKQMREGAPQKEMPRSTVKEDVARGLNAMPQAAMSAAGRDVMSQMPPQMMPPMMPSPQMPPQQMPPQQGMADGGIVAFRNGGMSQSMGDENLSTEERLKLESELRQLELDRDRGDVLFTIPEEINVGDYLPSITPEFLKKDALEEPLKVPFGGSQLRTKDTFLPDFITQTQPQAEFDPQKAARLQEIQNTLSPQVKPDPLTSTFGAGQGAITDSSQAEVDINKVIPILDRSRDKVDTSKEEGSQEDNQIVTRDKQKNQKEIDLFSNKQNKLLVPDKEYANSLKEMGDFSFSTDDQIEEARKKAAEKYKNDRKNPFKVFESAINDAREERDNIKKNNLNDALINAGAAILQAPGGQGLQWLGKGLGALQKKFEEGRSMLRDANKELRTSQIAKAQAEELRLQGEEAAADKAERNMRAADERRRKITENNVAKFAGLAQLDLNRFEAETNRIKANNNNKILSLQLRDTTGSVQSAIKRAELIEEQRQKYIMMPDTERKKTGYENADEYARAKADQMINAFRQFKPPSSGGLGLRDNFQTSPQTIPFSSAIGDQIRNQPL